MADTSTNKATKGGKTASSHDEAKQDQFEWPVNRSSKKSMTSTQVIRLQKFARSQIEAIGDFATGLAHEINQPLTVINSVIGYLTSQIDAGHLDTDKARRLLSEAGGEVQRISHLLERLYEFGEGNVGVMEKVDLRGLVEELLEIMGRRLLTFSVELSLTFPEDLPPLVGDKSQLKQGLLYLFDNAVEALAKSCGGEKRISIKASVDKKNKNLILIFSDNGVGVEDPYLDKIFEPFFTTKTEGATPGLGLSILYSIVKNHNGRIRCLPNIKQGAVFELVLPIHQ